MIGIWCNPEINILTTISGAGTARGTLSLQSGAGVDFDDLNIFSWGSFAFSISYTGPGPMSLSKRRRNIRIKWSHYNVFISVHLYFFYI